jgi:hypothetical protein
MGLIEWFAWFFFGDVIVAAFTGIMMWLAFDTLGVVLGIPVDSVRDILNMLWHYFWPALLAGGFLTSVTQKIRSALMTLGVWTLILVLFCFLPGNVAVPEAEKVATMNVTYAYNMYENGNEVDYQYKGFAIQEPAVIAQVIDTIDDAKYTHTHKVLLTKNDPLYDRLMVEFLDAKGKTLKKLTIINETGIRVDSKIRERFYRIRPGTGFDLDLIQSLAHNGIT